MNWGRWSAHRILLAHYEALWSTEGPRLQRYPTYYTVGKNLRRKDVSSGVHRFSIVGHRGDATYPLVKTFNSDVLPHAPSPLYVPVSRRPVALGPNALIYRSRTDGETYRSTS